MLPIFNTLGRASRDRLLQTGCDINSLRPWIGSDGRSYITLNRKGEYVNHLVTNTTATLRKEDWKILDEAIVAAAKPRLRAVADLISAGLVYNIPGGMGKTILETETMGDISDAVLSMDGRRKAPNDTPLFEVSGLPLPIAHKDFSIPGRHLLASRTGGSPLDTSLGEAAGRKVGEIIEKLLLGVETAFVYAGSTVYGYTNYTNVISRTITSPAAGGWTAATALAEVLLMKKDSQDAYHYGPWMLYCSPGWDPYMDNDYSTSYSGETLRSRLAKIEGINGVRTIDYLTGYTLLLVQMTSDVVRMVSALPITTVQWESGDGMEFFFKVMAVQVPQIRCDQNSRTGVVYGAPA